MTQLVSLVSFHGGRDLEHPWRMGTEQLKSNLVGQGRSSKPKVTLPIAGLPKPIGCRARNLSCGFGPLSENVGMQLTTGSGCGLLTRFQQSTSERHRSSADSGGLTLVL